MQRYFCRRCPTVAAAAASVCLTFCPPHPTPPPPPCQVYCGRYVNEHMVVHGTVVEHPVVLSFSDLSVWCYVCESYVHHQVVLLLS